MVNGEKGIAMPQFHVQLQFTYVKNEQTNDDFGTIPSDKFCNALKTVRSSSIFSNIFLARLIVFHSAKIETSTKHDILTFLMFTVFDVSTIRYEYIIVSKQFVLKQKRYTCTCLSTTNSSQQHQLEK